MKLIVGSVACGRFDALLSAYLETVTVNFPFICSVYDQVYAQLEEMFQTFASQDGAGEEITEFLTDDGQEGTEDDADDIFLREVLPALAESYPENVELQKLPLGAFERIPAVHRIIQQKKLSSPARKSLQKQLEHAVLEEVTTPLVDVVLQELDISALDELEQVDVSNCLEQRIRKLVKLR